MKIAQIRNELTEIVAMADMIRERACNANALLDRVYGSAPKGARKKGLATGQVVQLKAELKKSLNTKRRAV